MLLVDYEGSTMESRRGRWSNCWCVAVGLVICLSTYALWRCTLFVRSISGETPKHGVIKKRSDINVGCYNVRSRPAILAPCNRPRVLHFLASFLLPAMGYSCTAVPALGPASGDRWKRPRTLLPP